MFLLPILGELVSELQLSPQLGPWFFTIWGEKAGTPQGTPHLGRNLHSPRDTLTAFLSPLSLLCRGHQAGHRSPEEWWWDMSHPGLATASPWGLCPSVQSSYKTQVTSRR